MIINQLTYYNNKIVLVDLKVTQIGKTVYEVGDFFNLDGYQIMAIYTDGAQINVTDQCTFEPVTALTEGIQNITISFKDKNVEQSIQVQPSQKINYTMLYHNGNEYTDITGGWQTRAWASESGTTATAPTLTKEASSVKAVLSSSKVYRSGVLEITNDINIQPYSRLLFISSGSMTTEAQGYDYIEAIIQSREAAYSKTNALSKTTIANTAWNGTQSTSFTKKKTFVNISTVGNVSATIAINLHVYNATLTVNLLSGALFKQDDITTLAEKCSITATTIEEILTNSTVLLNNEDAVNFMLKKCTGDFMASAILNTNFLTALDSSPYKTQVYANEHWTKFLTMVA